MSDYGKKPVFRYLTKSKICLLVRFLNILATVTWGHCILLGTISETKADEHSRSAWTLQISGYTHHFKGTGRRAYPSWNNTNSGLGVQYDPWQSFESKWSTVVTAGVMKDSFGMQGAYAGAAQMYRLNDHRIQTKLGGGLIFLYRSFDWDDKRQPALILAPILSAEDTHSGLGINITGSPSVNYGNKRIVSFIFVQGTFRF